MLRDRPSERVGRRGRRGRSGAINMEYVFAGGLALIIVAALTLAIWHTFFRSRGGTIGDIPTEAHFQCRKCKDVQVVDMDKLTQKQIMQQGFGPMWADCPKCAKTDAAIEMAKCPKCEKYYVPKGYLRPDMMMSGVEGANICPHCKLDVQKYRTEEAMRRRKAKK